MWISLLSLYFLLHTILGHQVVLKQTNQIGGPFSYEWLHMLEQFHNTFGNRTKDDTHCLFPTPTFDCQPFLWDDGIVKRDAYHLRPQDIKSIIAIGDSMTAGFGMISGRPPFATVLEYRGKVFSVGGDPGEHTLPNFFSIYSGASQTGASKGTTLPKSKGKQLNNAISGAKAQDLDDELDRLTRMMQYEKYKHIKDDWKLITLFIGANNVCELCQPPFSRLPELADADVFEANVRAMLERIRTDVGKSFVNLVALFNVSSVYEASREDPYCRMVLDPSHMVICSCIQGNEKQRQAADRIVDEYNRRLQKLEREFKHKDIHQLGVSYQPSFADFPVSKYKQAYFSGVDCFHPNKCGNQVMATLLWNNMFSNQIEKRKKWDVETLQFVCPSAHQPYIQ